MTDGSAIELGDGIYKRLQRRRADVRYLLLGKLSYVFFLGHREPFNDLKCFCCFVGHGRSGGTLVGALLNAHPNIVMSNELHALRRLAAGLSAVQLYRIIYLVARRQARRGSRGGGGYTYQVPNQWQGRHAELTVIGDRKAGATAFEIVQNPQVLDFFRDRIGLEKKFIHVIRNPFDTITTTYHRTRRRPGEDPRRHLMREIRNYFARCTAVQRIEEAFGAESLCHVSHERLIEAPERQLQRLCEFLGVAHTEEYLRDCASIVKKVPHASRWTLDWPDEHKQVVSQGIGEFPWLEPYAVTW